MPLYERCDQVVGKRYFFQNIYWDEYTDGRRVVPGEVLVFISQYWRIEHGNPYFSHHEFDGLPNLYF